MINLNEVTKIYKNKKLLDNVSLTIDDGEVVGVIGKSPEISSLGKIIAGIMDFDKGTVKVDEIDVNENRREVISRVCLLPREFRVKDLTLHQIFERIGRKNSMSKKEIKVKEMDFFELLELKGLEDMKYEEVDEKVHTRFLISLVMLKEPNNVIFDRIESKLSEENMILLKELIREWSLDGKSIMLLSNDIKCFKGIADKIVFMENGRILENLEVLA